ncbi:MAG: hypothetical protein ACRDK4_14105 [Solirubrobacteraceae bacterium]
MPAEQPRKVDRQRWQTEIIRHLQDFSRQVGSLESAMADFGEDFDLQLFKQAFNAQDFKEYNRAQTVERALGRVQNYMADLAIAGVKLAGLKKSQGAERMSTAQAAFAALRTAKVIDPALYRSLSQAQRARTRIEHAYADTSAGDVHRAAVLIARIAREFIGLYRSWIEPYLFD